MHCFQNKSADKTSMKRIMKQPPQCMSFTLTFPRLGNTFNYCKMIGSHARWWNDLSLSGDFIPFYRVGNNARGVSPWWNYFIFFPLRFMQKVQFCWHCALINVHDILVKLPALATNWVPILQRDLYACLHFIFTSWKVNLDLRARATPIAMVITGVQVKIGFTSVWEKKMSHTWFLLVKPKAALSVSNGSNFTNFRADQLFIASRILLTR